ncbi:hypothetical protein [Dactylosporangium matsuzakiense]|uniref:hypothetical protein n=1 Tax=Dactylosporangium matsuzakiense TaxID=53360 RepID=UPI0022F34103|nr:hypothetical protein [Dactylosporangium matsuzakiense]
MATDGDVSAGRRSSRSQLRARFDRLFEQGQDAVLRGSHFVDVPPVPGGRWGMSAVLVPTGPVADRLAEVTAGLAAVSGSGHWPTGARDAVHLTVRAIEVHRPGLSGADPLVARCAGALARATAQSTAVRLRLDGLTLTPSGVMVCAYPVDPAADDFADRLGVELGADGWFEASYRRDIWYATLVHFAAEVSDPAGLAAWVRRRRALDLGVLELDGAELVTFRFNGRQPVRSALAQAPFGGVAMPVTVTGGHGRQVGGSGPGWG